MIGSGSLDGTVLYDTLTVPVKTKQRFVQGELGNERFDIHV